MRFGNRWAVVGGAALLLACTAAQARDFAVGGSGQCLTSLSGFNSNLGAVTGSVVWVTMFSLNAVWTFNGDGTGTATGRSVGVASPQANGTGLGGAGSSDLSSVFTWTLAAGVMTVNFSSVTGEQLTGGRAGQTFTITNLPTMTGRMSGDGRSITLATDTPAVETISFSNGDVQPRICTRHRILLRLN